jgi:hypothetical protein
MKRTILAAILISLAWPGTAKAGEIPSRSDMLKSLIVVGTYARICATPLSEAAKARTRIVIRMLGDVDSNALERSITTFSDGLASQDTRQWCRETGEALREGSK